MDNVEAMFNFSEQSGNGSGRKREVDRPTAEVIGKSFRVEMLGISWRFFGVAVVVGSKSSDEDGGGDSGRKIDVDNGIECQL